MPVRGPVDRRAAHAPFVLLVVLLLGRRPDRAAAAERLAQPGLVPAEQAEEADHRAHRRAAGAPAGRRRLLRARTRWSGGPASWAWCPAAARPSSTRTARSAACPRRGRPPRPAPPPRRAARLAASPATRRRARPSALDRRGPSARRGQPPAPRPTAGAAVRSRAPRAAPGPGGPGRRRSAREATPAPAGRRRVPPQQPPRRRAPRARPAAARAPRGRAARAPAAPAPPARQPAPPAAAGQPRPDPGHAGLRRPAAPGAGRRRQRVRRQGRRQPLPQPSAGRRARRDHRPRRRRPGHHRRRVRHHRRPVPVHARGEQGAGRPGAGRRPARADPRQGRRGARREARRRPKSRYVVLARRQTPQVWNQIKDLKSVFAEKARPTRPRAAPAPTCWPASSRSRARKRVYPNGDLAAGILGFVNAEGQGGGGLEAMLDKQLAGEDGKITYAQSGGRQVPTAGIQRAARRARHRHRADHRPRHPVGRPERHQPSRSTKSEADRGYVIVQDTRTGEVLAMANAPGFDPNDLSARRLGRPGQRRAPGRVRARLHQQGDVHGRRAGGAGGHPRHPRRRARTGCTAPTGSSTTTSTTPPGTSRSTACSPSPATSAPSSPPSSSARPSREANQVLHSYLRKFGIGSPPGSASPARPPASWPSRRTGAPPSSTRSPSARACRSTPCRPPPSTPPSPTAACGSSPRLVRGTTGPDGRFTPAPAPEKTRVVSEKTAKTARPRCWSRSSDDEEGTGTKARIPGYRVAGKTGTANRVDPDTGRYQRLHRLLRRLRARRQAADHRLLRHPEPDQGQLLRRPGLRPGLQEGHGVRPEDPPGRRRPASEPARLPGDLRAQAE